MQVAGLVFDSMTPLDLVGPLEVLARISGTEIVVVAAKLGSVRDVRTAIEIVPQAVLADVSRPDILVVPGGPGVAEVAGNPAIVRWIRGVHSSTTWTTSVCTGSVLLGAAGLLGGVPATTHWDARDAIEKYGARFVSERVVKSGRIVTAAGVSAGIDMALHLAALIAGPDVAREIQLRLEYDPQPPFDAGTPAKAGPVIVARARSPVDDHKRAS